MYLRKQLDFSAQWQMTHIFISPGYGTSLVTQFCLLIEEHPGTSKDWKGPANLSLLPEVIWDRTRISISNHTATTKGG